MAKRRIREEWRPVPGHPGYEVSDRGRVRSLDREVQIRHRSGALYKRFYHGQLLSPVPGSVGYYQVNVGSPSQVARIHNLVLLAFRGACPRGLEACHNNGKWRDNRLSNLRWGSRRSNVLDRTLHGTDNRGERCGSHKLRERDVREIRRSPLRVKDLAEKYGVSVPCICNVQSGKTWSWLR